VTWALPKSFNVDAATLLDLAMVLGGFIIKFYLSSFVVLYVWLTLLASDSIQVIIKDVQSFIPGSHRETMSRVMQWKKSYSYHHRLIQEMDRCFGPALLVYMSYMFFFFIFIPYDVFTDMKTALIGFILQSVWDIFRNLIYVAVPIISSKRMKDKVELLVDSSVHSITLIRAAGFGFD